MSRPISPTDFSDTPDSLQVLDGHEELNITASLEDLQTDEQRRVLDTVAQVRKCGLDSILSLPQLVVCGDQSAGKSFVLEALTEIPFPRNDNLYTRYATEIDMFRSIYRGISLYSFFMQVIDAYREIDVNKIRSFFALLVFRESQYMNFVLRRYTYQPAHGLEIRIDLGCQSLLA